MENQTQYNSDIIYETLENEIISLAIKPGQTLGENDLSARFGVSRTPVRAVLRRLADRGLVEITPYKGTRVTLLSLDEIEQMIYMRAAVEAEVLRDFADMVTPILMEKVRYIIRKQTVLIQGQFEHSQFYRLDTQLHEVWFREMGKMHIWELIKQAQVHYTRFRMLDIVTAQQYPQIVREHSLMFDCIERKDGAGLGELIKQHLYGGITRLKPSIEAEFADYFKDEQK